MNPELKNRLIGAFLKRVYSQHYQNYWLNHIENYDCLGQAIEYLYCERPDFLDLDTLDDNKAEFGIFCNILRAALKFSKTIPPVSTECDLQMLQARCQIEARIWTQYPNADYTNRQTLMLSDTHDGELNALKAGAIQVLIATTLKSRLPNLKVATPLDLSNALDSYAELYAKESNGALKASLKTELGLLKNVYKINKLGIIDIPNESSGSNLYCTVAESVGGVTEKLSLMSMSTVKEKLRNIVENANLDFNAYAACSGDYELVPKGILKLPKHGNMTEVQREAIALNIARILGFSTTQSTMVQHNGKAALFIPFDPIRLINEFAKGEKQKILMPSSFSLEAFSKIGESYLHYSTIVPVGNQLHADTWLEDFGYIMAFAYLCNDTDFIGGDNQNKGITAGKHLYIFDQVVMPDDKMELDTRLSLTPVGAGKYLRHNQGRNRTIVEDASFDAKLESITHLLANHDDIGMMLDHIIMVHQAKRRHIIAEIEQLNPIQPEQKMQLETLLQQQQALQILENDAIMIGAVITERMHSIFKHFPSVNDQAMTAAVFLANTDLIKYCLLFEKMLNKPVLFADDGRPYRHPWTNRHVNPVRTIKVQNELVTLGFDTFEIEQLIYVLQVCGINPDVCRVVMGSISIPLTELQKINEAKLFPELGTFHSRIDYLDVRNMAYSEDVYSAGMRAKAFFVIHDYRERLADAGRPEDKALIMKSALRTLQGIYASEVNKGFYKHLEIKLQFDIHQQLHKLIPHVCPELPSVTAQMLQALNAAVKLDRVNNLTQVLFAFVRNPLEQNKGHLMDYLCNCIGYAALATDYNEAKNQSSKLEKLSLETCQHISCAENNLLHMMMKKMDVKIPVVQQNWDEDEMDRQNREPFIQKEITEAGMEEQAVTGLFID